MKDDLNFLFGRQPQFFQKEDDLNIFQMKDDLTFFQMEDDLNLIQMEGDLNISAIGRQPHFFSNGRRTEYT